jgi:hypothetical protein
MKRGPGRDPRVDAYVAQAPPFARPILKALRAAVHGACPRAEETVKWGMPFFLADGKILCYMAAFKAHAAFGLWRRGKTAIPAGASKAGDAMGQLGRITSLGDLPPDAKLRGWIRKAARPQATEAARKKGR